MFISGTTNSIRINARILRRWWVNYNAWCASPILRAISSVSDSTWHKTEPNMAGTYLQSGAWRADCVLRAQRCRSHVFHVIDDVRDMRSWSANKKPRHNCAGEEMKWCRVWECWNYARAEICTVERELSKSVIGCSFSVGYQVCGRCLGVGEDALVLDHFATQDTNSRIPLSRLMMSYCYFRWLPFCCYSVAVMCWSLESSSDHSDTWKAALQ